MNTALQITQPGSHWGPARRPAPTLALRMLLVASLLFATSPAWGKGRRRRPRHADGPTTTFPADWESAPSARYAAMSRSACHSVLRQRKIAFLPLKRARGVLAPVRIPEGVAGVLYRTALPAKKRTTSVWDVFDCRLVLALYDLSAILKRHAIDEVWIFSSWRPPSKRWPQDKLGRRHPGALAVDLMRFFKRSEPKAAPGRVVLDVERDFHGKLGARTCGPGARAPTPPTAKALELHAIVCEASAARIFSSMLTPHYDRPHRNHFHFEIAPNVKWRILR